VLLALPEAFGEEVEWVAGRLPDSAIVKGEWLWDEAVAQDGIIAHTDKEYKDRNIRSFIVDSNISLNEDSKIIQYIYLDIEEPPLGIMLKLSLNEFEEPVSIYWEGDEEVFADMNEYITAWYMDALPEPGQWVRLEIDCDELELADTQLNGMSFVTHGGRAWWGRTVIKDE